MLNRGTVMFSALALVLIAATPLFAQAQDNQPKQQASTLADSRPPTVSVKESKEHLVTRVDATYPPIAMAAHVSGVAVIGAEIDAAGNVTTVVPLSGPAMLRAAAADAVKQNKYRPFLVNGAPVVVRTAVQVTFVPGHTKGFQ